MVLPPVERTLPGHAFDKARKGVNIVEIGLPGNLGQSQAAVKKKPVYFMHKFLIYKLFRCAWQTFAAREFPDLPVAVFQLRNIQIQIFCCVLHIGERSAFCHQIGQIAQQLRGKIRVLQRSKRLLQHT